MDQWDEDEKDAEDEEFMAGGCSGREGRYLYMYVQAFVGKKRRATD
jgi:hypothetical protein